MDLIQYTLPNGIRCILKRVRSAVAHCALTVNTGSRDELPSEYGLAHLLRAFIFQERHSANPTTSTAVSKTSAGNLNAYTDQGRDGNPYHDAQKAMQAKAVELIADIVFHSVFPQKEIDREKTIIIDEINSYKDTPSERIFDDFEDRFSQALHWGITF